MATPHSVFENYETETTSGVINIYYQSGSAFQYVQERLDMSNSTLRIVTGAGFFYHTNADTVVKVQVVDDSSNLVASSDNLTIYNSSNNKNEYLHYFLNDPYMVCRGIHYIRLVGVSTAPTSIHYTDTESGFSYYSNETTGMNNWFLDTKQYFINFIEEDVINLTQNENVTARIDFIGLKDAVDAYLLNLSAQPVKIVLEINSAGENLNLELYNYTNNGDMTLQNATINTTANYNPEILTYIPSSAGLYVLLVKPNDWANDASNYTLHWFQSSNNMTVTRPLISFNNDTMKLDISGVYASMDNYFYNGSSYQPEKAEYIIYRDVDDSMIGYNGSLYDYDENGEWTNLNIDVGGLNPGVYYVRARFEDNAGNAIGLSPPSSRFFVLGNLTVTAASVSYSGGMTQKLNISNIQVDNSTTLNIFTYTIFDAQFNANTSISGNLQYASGTQTWYANNIDVSSLPDGTYFVVGYFADTTTQSYGLGNNTVSTLNFFTIDQIIEVTQVYVNYTNQWTQSLEIGGLANTSYQGHGLGTPIQDGDATVTFQVYHNSSGITSVNGNLTWTGNSWNASIIAASLTEGPHFVRIIFSNESSYYNASGTLDSSIFWVTHVINITSLSQFYIGNETQIVTVEITANTSYNGNGVGIPIEDFADAAVLCTIVNNSNSQLTSVVGYATWRASTSSWKAEISTAPLPEGEYYVLVNFSIISNLYNASTIQNTTSFTIQHVLTLVVPTPLFNPDTATLDIVGIVAIDSYSGYHHINDTTALSTYFEIFNYTSKQTLGISGGLTYNSTFDDWRNTSIDLSMYPEGQFYIYVNITSIDVPEGNVANSSPFSLIHKIIITGVTIDYLDGFNQTLNITVASAVNTYQFHGNITHANYRFYYSDNQTAVQIPNLSGNLTQSGAKWTALVDVSKLTADNYYVLVNFADNTAANSKGSKDTTNFTVTHTLNVSTPLVTYLNGMDQYLNISCLVNSSYYYHRNFDSSTYGSGSYRIYLENGSMTSVTGTLQWNGTRWATVKADVSFLPVGNYRIRCNFSTSYGNALSPLSSIFSVSHMIDISQPTIIYDNNSKILTLLHITARSSYFNSYLTNLTALTSFFAIYTSSNQSTGITGQLSWNGSEWQVLNYPVVLSPGQYYIRLYFNDSQVTLSEISSNLFSVAYPEAEIDWVVVAVIILIVAAVVIVLIWLLFPEKKEVR